MPSVEFDPSIQKSGRDGKRKPHGGHNFMQEQDKNVMELQ